MRAGQPDKAGGSALRDKNRLHSRLVQRLVRRPLSFPAPEARALQALVRRRLDALLQMQTTEKNRLAAGPASEAVRASVEAVLAFLDKEASRIKQRIDGHIDGHPDLRQRRGLLTSIPGAADTTAAAILAELGEVAQFTEARQVAAFAGLAPRVRQSGTSVRGRPCLCKRGSPRLRHALDFPAVTALRFNPLVKALGERLKAKGKAKMLIVGAAMRKLLCICYGVLKSGRPFDPNFSTGGAKTT